jgi:uncharacterized protein YwgA
MKTKLLNIIIYIYENYPNISQLSKPRLVKLIYLIDWKNSIENKKQITNIKWYYNHYGPYVEDVIEEIKSNQDIFTVTSFQNGYGISDKISLNKNCIINPTISKENKVIIDFVIEKTNKLNWNDFISLIYDTYPIKNNAKYTMLNLPSEAMEYKVNKNPTSN